MVRRPGTTNGFPSYEKDTIKWKEYELFDIYSKLIELKKINKALLNGDRGGEIIFLESSDEQNIFAFTRSSGSDKVLCVFNLSDQSQGFELIGESLQGTYKNYFTGKLESFVSKSSLNLNPWEYRIYTK